jgi:hypothetical protein
MLTLTRIYNLLHSEGSKKYVKANSGTYYKVHSLRAGEFFITDSTDIKEKSYALQVHVYDRGAIDKIWSCLGMSTKEIVLSMRNKKVAFFKKGAWQDRLEKLIEKRGYERKTLDYLAERIAKSLVSPEAEPIHPLFF